MRKTIHKSSWNTLLIQCIFAFLFSSCKKEQPALSKTDCGCAKEVSADFVIEERSGIVESDYKYTITDTIFFNKNVRFKALDSLASYTWYIGSEVLNIRQVERYFTESLIGQKIPITLVVKKSANRICFPGDDGYDSITKFLFVSKYIVTTPDDYDFGSIEGIYRVKSAHLTDSFDIKIFISRNDNMPLQGPLLNVENYDGLGSNCYQHQRLEQRNYRQLFFENDGICENMRGNIYNRLDGITEINLKFDYEPSPLYHERKYLGRRL